MNCGGMDNDFLFIVDGGWVGEWVPPNKDRDEQGCVLAAPMLLASWMPLYLHRNFAVGSGMCIRMGRPACNSCWRVFLFQTW